MLNTYCYVRVCTASLLIVNVEGRFLYWVLYIFFFPLPPPIGFILYILSGLFGPVFFISV